MAEMTYFMLQVTTKDECAATCTLTEVAYRVGLHPELIERFIWLGLIDFMDRTEQGEPLFEPGVVPRIRQILRLRNDLGVNYAGIGLILDLMTRVEMLEARIRELE